MIFSRQPFRDHVARLRASADVADQARGENFRIEENVSAERLGHFEGASGHTDDVLEACKGYFKTHVQGRRRRWRPSTFDPALNAEALLAAGVDPNQKIVRLEQIDGVLTDLGWSFDRVETALAQRDPSDLGAFAGGFETRYRGARPAFAAFRSEVEDDIAADDWAERLCERLGLLHHFDVGLRQLALMEYTAQEVIDEAAKDAIERPFALATVLECQSNPAFHPVPRGADSGFAVDLGADPASRALIREMLHVRIGYKGGHVKKVRQCRVNGAPAILDARAAHIVRVRVRTNRDDFGAAA